MKKRHSSWISVGALLSLFVLYLSGCAHDDSQKLVEMDSVEVLGGSTESDTYGSIDMDDIAGVEEENVTEEKNTALFTEFEKNTTELNAPQELSTQTKPRKVKMKASFSPKIPDEAVESNGSLLNRFYFVRKSDTPHSVSQLLFGTTDKAKQIFDLVGGRSGWKVGTVIYYQSTDDPTDRKMKSFYVERNVKSHVYKVKKGDQLTSIANEFYGDEKSWTEIATINRMVNPSALEEGQSLVLSVADLAPYSQENWALANQTSRDEVKKLLANMEKSEMPRVQQASAGIGGFLRQNWLFVGSVFVIAAAALLLLVVLPKRTGF